MSTPIGSTQWKSIPHLRAEVLYCPEERREWTDPAGRKRDCTRDNVALYESLGVVTEMMYRGVNSHEPIPEIAEISRDRVVIGTRFSYAHKLGLSPVRTGQMGMWYFHVFMPAGGQPDNMDRFLFLLQSLIERYGIPTTRSADEQLKDLRKQTLQGWPAPK